MELSEKQRLQLIVDVFANLFAHSYGTELIGGAEEPLYMPSSEADQPHKLYFRENFIASALHEVAHWCIAGEGRLQQQDYGYWYQPDGRTLLEQSQFETVEVKPQALEWLFSIACGQKFRLSADNLTASGDALGASAVFKSAVVNQARDWCQNAQLPPRAKTFIDGLVGAFSAHNPYQLDYYQIDCLN